VPKIFNKFKSGSMILNRVDSSRSKNLFHSPPLILKEKEDIITSVAEIKQDYPAC